VTRLSKLDAPMFDARLSPSFLMIFLMRFLDSPYAGCMPSPVERPDTPDPYATSQKDHIDHASVRTVGSGKRVSMVSSSLRRMRTQTMNPTRVNAP
jgi:hypothetical protein